MVVQHNIEATNANKQLNKTEQALQISAARLSSGYKINTAADDAAGLKISEKMRSQIRGLARARKNAEDGISLVQTADGALAEVHDMLQRMNELCIQAINDTNTDMDRESMQEEVAQLITEVDRVADSTKYNGISLLSGDIALPGRNAYNTMLREERLEKVRQYLESYRTGYVYTALNGAQAGQKVTQENVDNAEGIKIVYIQDAVTTTQTGTGTTNTAAQFDTLKEQLKNELVPNAVNALLSAYPDAYGYLTGSSIGIGLQLTDNAGIGSADTLAFVRMQYFFNQTNNSVVPNMLTYQLCVNTDHISLANGKLTDTSRKELEVTIVHEMMHGFMDEVLTNGMTGTVNGVLANDRFPKWFIEGMAQTAAGGYYKGNNWVGNGLGITSSSSTAQISSALAANPLGGSSNTSNYATGYLASMYLGYLAGGKNVTAGDLQSGLGKVLNDIKNGKSLETEVKELTGYSSLADFETNFASDGNVAQFVHDLTAFVGNGTGGVVGGFITNDDILPDTSYPNVSLFALDTIHDTVQNEYPADYTVYAGGSATYPRADGIPTTPTTPTTTTAKPHSKLGLSLHVGANAGANNRILIYIDSMNAASIGISDVNVSTGDSATLSLEMVQLAINQVSAQRSELGAYQNRLEYTINNLANIAENTTAAESKIRDTDMAEEMVNFSASNILAQAGQAVLAQTNRSKQSIRTLLGA